jgi:hypothetical protein
MHNFGNYQRLAVTLLVVFINNIFFGGRYRQFHCVVMGIWWLVVTNGVLIASGEQRLV